MLAERGEQVTLRIVAREADIWNNLASHQADLGRKMDVLRRHCDELGRNPSEIIGSQQCLVTIAPNEAAAKPMADTAARIFGGHLGDPKGPLAITGTPERCSEQIDKHIALGCTMFIIEFFGRDTQEPAQLFAEEVMSNFR